MCDAWSPRGFTTQSFKSKAQKLLTDLVVIRWMSCRCLAIERQTLQMLVR